VIFIVIGIEAMFIPAATEPTKLKWYILTLEESIYYLIVPINVDWSNYYMIGSDNPTKGPP